MTRVKDLTNSRNKWKQKAKVLEKQSKELSQSASFSEKANGNSNRSTKNTDMIPKISVLSSTYEKKNPSNSSSQNLLPVGDVVDKYYGLSAKEILPHANGSANLIKGFLPWETASGHSYLLLIQQIGIQMVLEAHTS
jgi:hypothetical protein